MLLKHFLLIALFLLPRFAFSYQDTSGVLCVCIVAKNDDMVIRKCLDSVKEIADCLCICDLGSTDRTLEIVNEFMHKTGIPGKIYRSNSTNFERNRILAFHTAQKTLNEFRVPLAQGYILILDPDTFVKIGSGFRKESLKEDAYLVLENSASLSYSQYSPRLMRASLPLERLQIPHEALGVKKPAYFIKLQTLMIEESEECTYYTTEKLKRRVAELSVAIEKQPENGRCRLELAQTLKGLKQFEQALDQYQFLIKKGSPDEIWFAKYMSGECLLEANRSEEAIAAYLDAYQYNSLRSEPLYKIASYYRQHGQNDLAYLFAKQGARLITPSDPLLLPYPLLHPYQFDEEISIAAYYTPFKEEGYLAGSNLMLHKNVPKHIRDQAYQNILYYVENLKHAEFQPIAPPLPLIREGNVERYHPMNPSIVKTSKGYELICRAVNYTQTGANYFHTIDKDGIFRTRNFLLHYDQNFRLLGQEEIVENLPREKIPGRYVEGLEDCRIFQMNDGLWFTCNTSDTNFTGTIQISLCKMGNQPRGSTISVEKLIPLLGPDPYRCEKNWLPFIEDGHLYTIYSYDPFIIFQPNIETGECEPLLSYEPVHDFSHFRGSAGPVPFGDGYLTLIHEVIFRDHARHYLHRFVQLDKSFIVTQVSKPFTFRHLGVEYCCSMTLDHTGKKLILPIGIEDHEAYLCSIDLESVKALLRPLPPIADNLFNP